MVKSISFAVSTCFKSFNQLKVQTEQPSFDNKDGVGAVAWADELGRLRIWASNIGAHQRGQSSLDFRLRDASHISNQVITLLEDLEQILNDAALEMSGSAKVGLEDDLFETGQVTVNEEVVSSELQELYEEVVNIIDCLYQTSMLVRKPARHTPLLGCRKNDAAEFEFWDKKHVRDKFTDADDFLADRLGWATTQRRKHLMYWKRHNAKLGKGIEDVQGTHRSATGSVISETVATEFDTSRIDLEDKTSNSGLSETSYAYSLLSGGTVTVPPPPRDSQMGKPFECPYCYFLIVINDTRSWTRHVFADIRPYVCVFKDCETGNILYERRRDWVAHMAEKHHFQSLTCCLCKKMLDSVKQLERHVCRHLEEAALFVLPRNPDGSDYDGEANADIVRPNNQMGIGLSDSDSLDEYEGSDIDKNSAPDGSIYSEITDYTSGQQGSSINDTSPYSQAIYAVPNPKLKRSSSTTDGPTPSYPCLHPGCTYAPKRKYDLDRHMTSHSPPTEVMFDCPGRGCTRKGTNGFKRKDHMNEHLVNFHLWDTKTKKPRPREGGEKRERR